MNKEDLEEGTVFSPRFDEKGLIPCVTVCAETDKVLMVAYMNEDALQKTLSTREGHYWSRSRQSLWHKGATSGYVQDVQSLHTDCDQDCLVMSVIVRKPDHSEQEEGTCHTGRKTCFYRRVDLDKGAQGRPALTFDE